MSYGVIKLSVKTFEQKNYCEVIYEMFHILNCGVEIKWAMIIAVMNAIEAIAYRSLKKSGLFRSHNCGYHSSLDFNSAVQYMKHFIYHLTSILHGLIRTHK